MAATRRRISVVIPAHNYGRYLAGAVASVGAQTRPADEIVIVDDGSTDGTADVVVEIMGRLPGVTALHRSPARGPAATFNDGVRASTGALVVILSADDRLSPRYLELMEPAFEDPTVAFAYARADTFGAEHGAHEAGPFDRRELMRENTVNGSAMFRREVFDAVGGFRSDFDRLGLEDWEFWVHAVARGGVGRFVDGCWLEYRRHEQGSRNSMPRARVLRAHLRVWRLHPDVMGVNDILTWLGRSTRRNVRRRLTA